ncbi:MAG TPA: hypothetical protein GX722_08100 [Clostridiales bacterium]|jgi:DNA primase|nr:hypothetical protein [Clostridiales bacterium]
MGYDKEDRRTGFDLFERCREISALQVAGWLGLKTEYRSGKRWACCPIHGERNPSLMFDKDGRWHCFGCGRGGDAVDLWSAVYRVPLGIAAREVMKRTGELHLYE